MITDAQLQRVMPQLPAAKRALYLPHLNQALQAYAVNTLLRTAAFVAQLAHESAEFRFMEELWGPTPAQLRYEPPADLAERLGNSQPGDGKRFKGRGPIQITGRYNYRKYGELLGVDLEAQPEATAKPELAFSIAGLFWVSNGLNELADAEQFITITKRINGGTNGLAERRAYYEHAKAVLTERFVAGAARSKRAVMLPQQALTRGHEVLVAFDLVDTAARPAPARKAAAKTTTKTPAKRGAPPRASRKPTAA
ncbi:MAG: glycoside hydrolase family 19 protein [Burkholderiales bacterium]